MQKKKRNLPVLLLLLSLLLALPVQAAEIKRLPGGTNYIKNWPEGPKTASLSAVLMEADTGVVVYNKRMSEKRYPASTTKILTALLVLENASLDETVTFDETGLQEIYSNNSNIGMLLGETLTVEQCLYGLLLESANEIATQLAAHVGGGSVETFVQMMNDRAAELGCTGTHFTNASGLPDENHYTTAYDLALILQECLKNETFRKICGTYQYQLPATNVDPNPQMLTNHHPLIQPGQYFYQGVTAGKTGYTDMSKNTLVTAAVREDTTYLAVTLGADIGGVINDTTALLNYGFDSFEKIPAENSSLLLNPEYLLVPKGTERKDLTFEAEEEGALIRRTYRFGRDTYVGTALLKKTDETMIQKPEIIPEPLTVTGDGPLDLSSYNVSGSMIPYIIIGVLSILIFAGIGIILIRLISRKKR